MKKSSLVICSLLVAASLTACGQEPLERLPESVDIEKSVESEDDDLDTSESIDANDTSDSNNSTAETKKEEEVKTDCTFTKKKAAKVKEYLEGYTYINAIQTLENGVKDDFIYTDITYNVFADTVKKIAELNILTSFMDTEQKGDGGIHYIRDFDDDITYERDEDDKKWIESDGKVLMVDWDLVNYNSVYDIWKYLIKNCDIATGTKGYISGNYEYYTVESEVSENMVEGLKYDKLGKQEATYIFERRDGLLIPTSVVVDVTYYLEDTECYLRNTIQLCVVGNNTMEMPELDEDE